jgi:four helix bundle protein
MTNKELKDRTQKFAIDVIKLTEELPKTRSSDVLGKQLLRSACAVGANYRAACRAQSYTHFISKLGIVEEEADESLYWFELIIKSGIAKEDRLNKLMKEANELTAIFTAGRKTSRKNKEMKKNL